jgi:hypothetical protein
VIHTATDDDDTDAGGAWEGIPARESLEREASVGDASKSEQGETWEVEGPRGTRTGRDCPRARRLERRPCGVDEIIRVTIIGPNNLPVHEQGGTGNSQTPGVRARVTAKPVLVLAGTVGMPSAPVDETDRSLTTNLNREEGSTFHR